MAETNDDFQVGTPWSDGTGGVTQCAILPGESFTYKFTADLVRPKN